MIELLPCPFCGYEASISEVESAGGNGRIIHIVGCNSEDCDVSFHGHARKVDAAKAWNSRFATAEVTPYRDALRALVKAVGCCSINCEHLSHNWKTFHGGTGDCPVETTIRKALADAAALLTEGEKG